MQISLSLTAPYGPPWHHDPAQQLWVRGFIFDEQGTFLEGAALLAWLNQRPEPSSLFARSGHFACVSLAEGSGWAMVDPLRTLPLLYQQKGDTLYVSDDFECLPGPLAWRNIHPFLHAGHALGKYTWCQDVFALQAGDYLNWQGTTLSHKTYWYATLSPSEQDELALRNQLRQTALRVFQRLIDSAAGRPLVIPLSGGYDSRFIAAMLKHLGYPHVRCFTYGKPGNPEARISQQVAEKLGFPWKMVPYTAENRLPYLDEKTYHRYAANGVSLPHDQDYTAVQALKVQGFIPADALLVPGFGGDVLAGSWYAGDLDQIEDRTTLIQFLSQNPKFFAGKRNARPRMDRALIEAEIHVLPKSNPYHPLSDLQAWGLRNRMSKYLINSVRAYEYLGLGWRLPFFDLAWIEFWQQVSLPLRRQKYLYLSEANHWLFEPMGIAFVGPSFQPVGWQARLKQFLPADVINWVKFSFGDPTAYDHNNDQILIQEIVARMGLSKADVYSYGLNYLLARHLLEEA